MRALRIVDSARDDIARIYRFIEQESGNSNLAEGFTAASMSNAASFRYYPARSASPARNCGRISAAFPSAAI
jgi:hypothetical protein